MSRNTTLFLRVKGSSIPTPQGGGRSQYKDCDPFAEEKPVKKERNLETLFKMENVVSLPHLDESHGMDLVLRCVHQSVDCVFGFEAELLLARGVTDGTRSV